MAAPSFDELYTLGKAELLLRRPDLFVNDGDVSDFLLAAASAMGDKCVQQTIAALRKTFIDSAIGSDLTALVQDHWALGRTAATLAIGSITFNRASAAAGAGTIPAGTVVGTDFDNLGERVEFVTDLDISYAVAETGNKIVTATAILTGPDSNVGIATVVNVVSAIFDTSVTVSNPALFAGGNNQETDDELRSRARNFPSTLRRGTLSALEFGAKTVSTVTNSVSTESATGLVTVFVADSSGNSNSQMLNDVEDVLENFRCAGTSVTVTGGVKITQPISLTVTVRAGAETPAFTSQIQTGVTEALQKLRIGEDVYHTVVKCAARDVAPDKILDVTVLFTPLDANLLANGNTTSSDPIVTTNIQIVKAGTVTVTYVTV